MGDMAAMAENTAEVSCIVAAREGSQADISLEGNATVHSNRVGSVCAECICRVHMSALLVAWFGPWPRQISCPALEGWRMVVQPWQLKGGFVHERLSPAYK